jgi:[ribosomal protein S5]-alanine N-acetyltransferase
MLMHALVTERLLLRRFRDEDGPALFDCLSDPETVQFEPYEPLTRGEADAEAARRAADEAFAAVCLRDGTLVGNVWLGQGEFRTFELGYVFGRRHWGYGYATEAARAVVDHAFADLVAHRVIAMCATGNRASWRLAERLGMRREGLLRQNVSFRRDPSGAPIWWDTYCFAVLAEEWLARPNSQKGA